MNTSKNILKQLEHINKVYSKSAYNLSNRIKDYYQLDKPTLENIYDLRVNMKLLQESQAIVHQAQLLTEILKQLKLLKVTTLNIQLFNYQSDKPLELQIEYKTNNQFEEYIKLHPITSFHQTLEQHSIILFRSSHIL